MKKTILILLTVLLAVSCSQVVYDGNLPLENLEDHKTTLSVEQAENSTDIVLKFKPVPYVSSYGYSINGSEPVTDFIPTYQDGIFSYRISGADHDGVIVLYGNHQNTGWSPIGETFYSIVVDGVAPDAYLYARYENSVAIKINPISEIPTSYKITAKTGAEVISEQTYDQSDNNIYTIENISRDVSCTIEIAQWSFENNDYSTNTKELNIEPFENEVKLIMGETSDAFIVTVPPDLSGDVSLMKNDKILLSKPVVDEQAVFNYDELLSLESGLFYASISDGSSEYVSNYIETIIPLNFVRTVVNYKSIDLVLDFAEDIDTEQLNLAVIGAPGSTISDPTEMNGETMVTISNLDSNREYSISIRAMYNNESIVTPMDLFTTRSFAGKFFEWNGSLIKGPMGKDNKPDANFIIYVAESKEGSIYPYYIYFSKNDDVFSGSNFEYEQSNLRIMPLVDVSIGECQTSESNTVNFGSGKTEDNNDLGSQNNAYKTNSIKWNSMEDVDLIKWFVSSDDTNSSKDIVTTETTSYASILPNFPQKTNTTFIFNETRDENNEAVPYIKFKNIGQGMVTLGLYSNKDYKTEWEKFETIADPDAEYCWYLSPVDLSE